MGLQGVRHAIVWVLHDPEATAPPSSGVAELGSNSTQLGEDCSVLRIEDLDGEATEQPGLSSGPPTLGSMQIAAAIEFRPEQADPWVVVGLTRGGSPGIRSCKGLAEAEELAALERRQA